MYVKFRRKLSLSKFGLGVNRKKKLYRRKRNRIFYPILFKFLKREKW